METRNGGMIHMNKITIIKATALTSPNPISLLCTEKPDGSTNLAAVSFYSYLSFQPEMLCFAMDAVILQRGACAGK